MTALVKLGGLLLIISLAKSTERHGKFSVFQVVEFPNDACKGDNNRNGTCYTKEECDDKGGTSGGSCAEGYGICCIQTLSCGQSTNDNNTYLMQNDATMTNSPCAYKVCPCNNNICRIRYDFMTFTLAAPFEGTVADATVQTAGVGGAIGDCLTDTFSISSQGSAGSPVICGANAGQHMILDVDARKGCQTAAFTIGGAAGNNFMRSWDIKVTQYGCGNQDLSGAPGCLQYFTGAEGQIMSFNFPTGNAVTATATHLSNQKYSACIRREANMGCICYSAAEPAAVAAATQGSFGLSVSTAAAAAKSATDSNCAADFLAIGNGFGSDQLPTIPRGAVTGQGAAGATLAQKFCGRKLNNQDDNAASITVCSGVLPFRIGVNFDADEVAPGATALLDERDTATGGIVGFKLDYKQVACT